MTIVLLIIGTVLGSGWLLSEYNIRTLRTRNRLLNERQARLERQVEELHNLYQIEQGKVEELTQLSAEANSYRQKLNEATAELDKLHDIMNRFETNMRNLRSRAMSREYFGNSLGKIIVTMVDKLIGPEVEKENQISDSVKNVFQKARRAMGGGI
ncbi:MAG: hypothetical protein OEZ43_15355 [Gammaproteobacteria bacterium]|nr:hypothetical protein [Gammaproteobacteria bacterium]